MQKRPITATIDRKILVQLEKEGIAVQKMYKVLDWWQRSERAEIHWNYGNSLGHD
jgi:hypothetical protein